LPITSISLRIATFSSGLNSFVPAFFFDILYNGFYAVIYVIRQLIRHWWYPVQALDDHLNLLY
jgi:hypothetical protein